VQVYRDRCRERGFPEPGPDRFAYLALCYTGETDEEAQREGRGLMWYLNRYRHPQFNNPPGYNSYQNVARSMLGGAAKPRGDSYESLQEKGIVLVGNPDTMIKKIRYLHERCGIGHLLMMTHAGSMESSKVRRNLELFAREVYPAIRELGEPSTPTPEREVARV
jgi:alkanesulfonate monooxygenase SsuD/methylene tetrahydromethanopterin reductase-like flavin-dependent oxidoreductase (luciferase family)